MNEDGDDLPSSDLQEGGGWKVDAGVLERSHTQQPARLRASF